MIDHTALMELVRRRIADERVLGLVKAFSRPGLLRLPVIGGDTDRTPWTGSCPRCSTSPSPSWTIISPAVGPDDGDRESAGPTPPQ